MIRQLVTSQRIAYPAPPRPNPGPEPLPGPEAGWLLVLPLAAGILGLAVLVRFRRRTARGQARPLPVLPALEDVDEAPIDLVAAAAAVRRLVARATSRDVLAQTTEEIAASAGLLERLGPEDLAALLAVLEAADRQKFRPDGSGLEDSAECAATFVRIQDRLRSAPGPTSSSAG